MGERSVSKNGHMANLFPPENTGTLHAIIDIKEQIEYLESQLAQLNQQLVAESTPLPEKTVYREVYILLLTDNYYYVGETEDVDRRLTEHYTRAQAYINGDHIDGNISRGAWWTMLHPPIALFARIPWAPGEEDRQTELYMFEHGVDKVRGGSYSQVILEYYQLLTLEHKRVAHFNLCYRCHQAGHYGNRCNNPPYRLLAAAKPTGLTVDEAKCIVYGHALPTRYGNAPRTQPLLYNNVNQPITSFTIAGVDGPIVVQDDICGGTIP